MRLFKVVVIVFVALPLMLGARMYLLGQKSGEMKPEYLGPENDHLQACGSKPNCVSTQADPSSDFYIEPLVSQNIEGLWDDLMQLLPELGYRQMDQKDNYSHYEVRTPLLGFVDDVEFLLDSANNQIQMRSRSRVGYSDLGANRKRLEKLRKTLQPRMNHE